MVNQTSALTLNLLSGRSSITTTRLVADANTISGGLCNLLATKADTSLGYTLVPQP